MSEELTLEAYFDPQAGRWLEVTFVSESDMTIETPQTTRGGPMGFTNHFRFVR